MISCSPHRRAMPHGSNQRWLWGPLHANDKKNGGDNESTLTLKLMGELPDVLNRGYLWPHKMDLGPAKNFFRKWQYLGKWASESPQTTKANSFQEGECSNLCAILTGNHILYNTLYCIQYGLVVTQWQDTVDLSIQQTVTVIKQIELDYGSISKQENVLRQAVKNGLPPVW